MKELNEKIVRSNEYFQTGKWVPAAVNPNLKLPNCTTFCMCAWHWVFDATKSYQVMKGRSAGGFGNAKTWYTDYLFEKGKVPKVAAIGVFDGTYGHVVFVKSFEELDGGYYNITVYESNYPVTPGLAYFREVTYKVKAGLKTVTGLGKFLGFCYHPYYTEDEPQPEPTPTFQVGKIYTLKYTCNVRFGPGKSYKKKTKSQLTKNARAYATAAGALKKGTEVTCLETRKDSEGNIWMRIPSGWIAAYYDNEKYLN